MTTPDPIALPESGAKPYKCDYCGEYYGARACCGMRYDYLRHHGESILPPASALTPTPQVQGDMVLLPRRATPEMLADFWYTATGSAGGGFWLTKRQLARARKAYAAMLAAAPPLNELLGQPEEFNLNEVSGNSGQLASLEQRARELFEAQADPLAAPWERQWEPTKQYWRGQAAALSAQPREVECAHDWRGDGLCDRCGATYTQPREVRGVVPPGFALVPIEPTWDMRNEGREFLIDGIEKEPEKLAYFLWKTMVAAAPEVK